MLRVFHHHHRGAVHISEAGCPSPVPVAELPINLLPAGLIIIIAP
jgi:hypothetical protein